MYELQKSLTTENIITLVTSLGADRYDDKENYIIFPTICHNENSEDASMKLYYYKNTGLFTCYTDCGESFNIYTLIEKVYNLQNKEHYPIEWIAEGITRESMDKYNILYSISRNKIIIPHYNINGQLIGIRGRSLNKREIEEFGKYMPIEIEGKWYNSPLSQNLYGLNISKESIKKDRRVIIFEGEKSSLKYDKFFPGHNISCAVCGSSLNKNQLNILLKNFELEEIIIAFDKEYQKYNSEEGRKYFNKLEAICKKYQNYCNFSFLFDKEDLLKLKDSPVDRGKNIFLHLYDHRIHIRSMLN